MSYEKDKLISDGIGYRCVSYSEGGHTESGTLNDILEFEMQAGNDHILKDINKVLDLGLILDDVVDESWWEVRNAVVEKYGEVRAQWLTTDKNAKILYCREDEDPVPVMIPDDAIPATDLGPDGTLFLYLCKED